MVLDRHLTVRFPDLIRTSRLSNSERLVKFGFVPPGGPHAEHFSSCLLNLRFSRLLLPLSFTAHFSVPFRFFLVTCSATYTFACLDHTSSYCRAVCVLLTPSYTAPSACLFRTPFFSTFLFSHFFSAPPSRLASPPCRVPLCMDCEASRGRLATTFPFL